jgi:hypothetical protein
MGEGEHTVITRIPRERLNQIASRKLSALGLAVRLGPDHETLEGELAFGAKVLHPATGLPVARARFAVVGHDHLRFLDPPLAALGPLAFHAHERLAALEQAVAAALAQRAAALQELAPRMRTLGLETALDADRVALRAVVRTPSHAFELLGGPEGVRVSRVAPVGGRPFEVATSYPAVDLGAFPTAADLEAFLVHDLPSMASAPSPSPATPGGGPLQATPPPRNALTLAALARAFGPDAMVGADAPVELVQEFEHGGTRYRFVAARELGTRFKGRLIGPAGDVWSERFDLARFPGLGAAVARALGAGRGEGSGAPAPLEVAAESGGAVGLPEHLVPHPGEVWVMNVVVEEAGPAEVRYVGTDVDGRPYGAARVLKRADFEAVFTQEGGGWRLLVRLDQVQGGHVVYRQLDRARQPIGAPRKMAAAILVANFVPEGAAHP